MNTKYKAGHVDRRSDLSNQIRGRKFNGFDVSDYAINEEKLQSDIFSNLIKHKKVIKLDHRCSGCKNFFTAKKMSRCPSICRKCFSAAQDKGKIALGNFIAKAASNYQRIMREALQI